MPPQATDEYGHGQMMGMLVVIAMFERARDAGQIIKPDVLADIKKIAVSDLSEYLDMPEEDVYLMIESQIKEVK